MTQMVKFLFDSVKNIVWKGENAGYHDFLLFTQCFHKAFSIGVSKVVIVWYRVKICHCMVGPSVSQWQRNVW